MPKRKVVKQRKVSAKQRKHLVKARAAALPVMMGNEFWQIRSRHGVEALFTDPVKLLEAGIEYIDWVNTHPLYRAEWRGKGLVNVPVKRVATLKGFCIYCDVLEAWWRQFKDTVTYKNNKDFATVMGKVEEIIYSQKYEGAASGFFNVNIIARDLGLVDRVDTTSGGEKISMPPLNVFTKEAPPLADAEDKIK